jgi:hypothetical protein
MIKKYLVVNLPRELNIYPVNGGDDCTCGNVVIGVWCVLGSACHPTLTALAVALYSGWLIVSFSGSSLILTR